MTTEVGDQVSAGPFTAAESALVDAFLESHHDELIAFRRHMHAHPELSGLEFDTTEAVVNRLQVAGLNPVIVPTGTGLVCDVGVADSAQAQAPVPIVALRADLDALAMIDESSSPYHSTVVGVAHACGHDVHTTVVLGAGLLLARLLALPGAPAGVVRLIFEPSEEMVPGGAVDVVAHGFLADVGVIYGLHCDPKVDVGKVGVKSGAITSAADLVEIVITGPGGHTARPEQTVNLVAVAARIALEVPVLLADGELGGAVKMVFGSMRAGDAANVIPSVARLTGSLRTPSWGDWEQAPDLLRQAIAEVVEPTGAVWDLVHRRGVPPVVNDSAATAIVAQAAAGVLGPDAVESSLQSWGGDSFGWYLEETPGSYVRLGTHDPNSSGPRLDLHAGSFDVDEAAIAVGIRVLVATALLWLRSQ